MSIVVWLCKSCTPRCNKLSFVSEHNVSSGNEFDTSKEAKFSFQVILGLSPEVNGIQTKTSNKVLESKFEWLSGNKSAKRRKFEASSSRMSAFY